MNQSLASFWSGWLFALFCCLSVTAAQEQSTGELEKLKAFARTFGYVRYFHPSDEAALVDWEAMAYYGTREILDSEQEETRALLRRLFDPIVVDFEVYAGPEKPRPVTQKVDAKDIVAWQHIGVGQAQRGIYRSARINRTQKMANSAAAPFGNLLQRVDATELQGKEIRYRFKARIEEGECRLQGWYRADRPSGKIGLFDNMAGRPITSKQWDEYELSGTVDEDAKHLVFGVMFFGPGSALVDDVRLEQKTDEGWIPLEIGNSDFELGKTNPENWITNGQGYSIRLTSDDTASGTQAVRLRRRLKEEAVDRLFDEIPELGELVDKEIAANLRIRMPLVLPVDTRYRQGTNQATDTLLQLIEKSDVRSATPRVRAVANTILLWNVFQHFYPYFEQVDCDWASVLVSSLERALRCESRQDTTATLQWLVAQLHDGHGMVFDQELYSQMRAAAVDFAWLDNQLVVRSSDDANLQMGDIITKINGEQAIDYITNTETLISGSPQWKRYRSISQLSVGKDALSLEVERNGKTLTTDLKYGGKRTSADEGAVCRLLVDNEADTQDIWYVDLGRAEPKDVNDKLEQFAKAKGIVFDLRGYPRGTEYLFQHMTDQHMQSQKWQVPFQIRPDRVDMKEIETRGRWEMPPRRPRFQGKMVFITNASAVSYAESCMSIVAHYNLGEIVGSPTAGANGNVNPFSLPGGYRISWTGMRVMNHDDSQHHVRGVQPTIPLEPTLDGILQGKDELLEKALQLIVNESP